MRDGIRHPLQLTASIVLGIACMFYPFMPGTHDRLAVSLSGMVQALAFTGLLMVPIGVLWFAHDVRRRRQRAGERPERGSWFALSAMGASLVVVAGVAIAAAAHTGPSLAVAVVVAWIYCLRRAFAAVKRMRTGVAAGFNAVPLYLILLPSVLVIARTLFLPAAVESSRARTIAGSVTFINAIENHRAAYGHYPVSLASVHHDYDPPTVGVERYHYEPQGQAYNVFFEQPTYPIGMVEFVMYNPLGQHEMIVHNQDVLESPAEQVARERAYHARGAHDAGVPRWKYFWFD